MAQRVPKTLARITAFIAAPPAGPKRSKATRRATTVSFAISEIGSVRWYMRFVAR